MFRNFIILRYIVSFILPYLFCFAIYIQLNGDVSPGGGFQGGVIFATALIAYDFIFSIKVTEHLVDSLILIASTGIFIIIIVALLPIFYQDQIMNYSALAQNHIWGQHLGIFFFELAVGIAVSSVITMIYFLINSMK